MMAKAVAPPIRTKITSMMVCSNPSSTGVPFTVPLHLRSGPPPDDSRQLYPQTDLLRARPRPSSFVLEFLGKFHVPSFCYRLQGARTFWVEDFLCIKKEVLHKFRQS